MAEMVTESVPHVCTGLRSRQVGTGSCARIDILFNAAALCCKTEQTIAAGNFVLAITIYGIKNCDTMKKARAWLDQHGVEYNFHDYKAVGIDKERLAHWSKMVGWEMLLNRAGTTFRKLSDADKDGITEKKALALMLAQPSMIKRPVLEIGGKLLVGFKPEIYEKAVKP
jgi:Spx/MgsR family transcriptional regulator